MWPMFPGWGQHAAAVGVTLVTTYLVWYCPMTGNDTINNNKKKRTKTLARESERGTERKESGLLFAPHFLLAFCFILSRMTSAAHPRSVSFHLPSALSLHFKLALVFSSVCQISPHDGIICSARCALMHITLLSITHRPITPMTD